MPTADPFPFEPRSHSPPPAAWLVYLSGAIPHFERTGTTLVNFCTFFPALEANEEPMSLDDIKTRLRDSVAKIADRTPTASAVARLWPTLVVITGAAFVVAWCALLAYGVFRLYAALFG
jgi:hypothetical protein